MNDGPGPLIGLVLLVVIVIVGFCILFEEISPDNPQLFATGSRLVFNNDSYVVLSSMYNGDSSGWSYRLVQLADQFDMVNKQPAGIVFFIDESELLKEINAPQPVTE